MLNRFCLLKVIPPLQNYFWSSGSPRSIINEFFYLKKKCFILEIFRFLCFCEIGQFQNLWCYYKHCWMMEVTLILISLNPKYYQNEIWSNASVLYDKNCCMTTCFWLNAGDWKLAPGFYMILLKWQNSKIWPFLMIDIYHFYLSLTHLYKKRNTGILI